MLLAGRSIKVNHTLQWGMFKGTVAGGTLPKRSRATTWRGDDGSGVIYVPSGSPVPTSSATSTVVQTATAAAIPSTTPTVVPATTAAATPSAAQAGSGTPTAAPEVAPWLNRIKELNFSGYNIVHIDYAVTRDPAELCSDPNPPPPPMFGSGGVLAGICISREDGTVTGSRWLSGWGCTAAPTVVVVWERPSATTQPVQASAIGSFLHGLCLSNGGSALQNQVSGIPGLNYWAIDEIACAGFAGYVTYQAACAGGLTQGIKLLEMAKTQNPGAGQIVPIKMALCVIETAALACVAR